MARCFAVYKNDDMKAEDERFLQGALGASDGTNVLAACPSPVAFANKAQLPRTTARCRSLVLAAGVLVAKTESTMY